MPLVRVQPWSVIKWVARNGRRTCPKPCLKGRKRAGAPERRRSTLIVHITSNAGEILDGILLFELW